MPKSINPTKTKVVKPALKDCPKCAHPLYFKYTQDRKTVYHLDKVTQVRRNAYHCTNPTCELYEHSIVGPREGVKYHQVGFDLIAYVGLQRVKEKKILEEIQTTLKCDHGIHVTAKTVSNWTDVFLQLVTNEPHPETIARLRNQPVCILSVDGVKPRKADMILYIFREVITGKILLARTVRKSDTKTLEQLFHQVKALGLPLAGIVSDKQRAIILAAKTVFPAVPHQYCQFHYMSNISKDFQEQDRCLRKEVRKKLRPITQTQKTARNQYKRGDLSKQEYELLLQFYEVVKAASRRTAKYPFKPVGLQLYRDIYAIEVTVKRLQKTHPLSFFPTILKHTAKIRKTMKPAYTKVKQQFDYICEIQAVLDRKLPQDVSSRQREQFQEETAEMLQETVTSMSTEISNSFTELKEWSTEVVRVTTAFLPGLFTHYTVPSLPRTNNDLEQYFNRVQSGFFKILNRPFIHRFFLRRAEFWVFALEVTTLPFEDIVSRLRENGSAVLPSKRERFETLASHFRLERTLRQCIHRALKDLITEWEAMS